MAVVFADPAIPPRLDGPVETDGWTLHACLDEVGRRRGMDFVAYVLDHAPGENWRLSDRVEVRINGALAETVGGLGAPTRAGDVVDVRRRIGPTVW